MEIRNCKNVLIANYNQNMKFLNSSTKILGLRLFTIVFVDPNFKLKWLELPLSD